MLSLGLTGGIGAGKSTVARRLAELGAVVVDADLLARAVVAPGTPGLAGVVAAFGAQILTPGGDLDRPKLGRIVFADDAARRRLEEITHPLIAAATAEAFAAAPAGAIRVHDMPLLVEKQMGTGYHLVLVVHADVEERVRRLVTLRGMTEDDARARIAAQADDDARRAAADVWLDNSGSPPSLIQVVDALWHSRLRPFADNLAARRPAVATPGFPAPDDGARARTAARLRRRLGERASRIEVSDDRTLAVGVGGAAPASIGQDLEAAGFAWIGGNDDRQRYGSCDPGCALELLVTPA